MRIRLKTLLFSAACRDLSGAPGQLLLCPREALGAQLTWGPASRYDNKNAPPENPAERHYHET